MSLSNVYVETCMWRELKGEITYRFQTDEKDIATKMKRRQKFDLVSWAVNYPRWIYTAGFSRPDLARAALKSLTGKKIIYNAEEEIYYAEGK